MRKLVTTGLLGLALSFGAISAWAGALSAENTPIAEIAATPEGKAALDKNLPGLTSHGAYEQFKSMSLKQVQPLSGGAITDDQIKAVQADLNKAKK
ncbi:MULTISPECIES: hypothetical protein [Phenylobacterium]|uniref:Uncharacterized protein n=1 Tax=Phenylobacterium koreense TaxID=266125 RepID=A0ABV2EL17_9CAUL